MRRVVVASVVVAVAAWTPAVYALPAVTNVAAAGCESSTRAASSTDWCTTRSEFGALDGRLPERRDAFGSKSGTFAALMQDLGLDADEIVYPQTSRVAPLRRSGLIQATPKKAAILPEPATWVMLLLGFGAIGAFVRRRFRKSEERFNERIRSIEAGEVR